MTPTPGAPDRAGIRHPARLLIRDGSAAANLADIEALLAAYKRVVTTFAPYLPVWTLET